MTLPDFVLNALDQKIEDFFEEHTFLAIYGPEDQARMREAMRDAGIEDLEAYLPIFEIVWQDGHSWGWNDRAVLSSHPGHVEHQNPFKEES